jgi:hypothetical protein
MTVQKKRSKLQTPQNRVSSGIRCNGKIFQFLVLKSAWELWVAVIQQDDRFSFALSESFRLSCRIRRLISSTTKIRFFVVNLFCSCVWKIKTTSNVHCTRYLKWSLHLYNLKLQRDLHTFSHNEQIAPLTETWYELCAVKVL